ncbi:enterochelin esterase [Pseudonocardia kunmingensis]|nr:enterochelin esterase [Pseudonocardia kunmingensis]
MSAAVTSPRPKPTGPAALTVPPQQRRTRPPERLDPLASCALLATAGRAGFWPAVAAAGTPLVDRLPGDDRHRAVTFLWRGDEPADVLVLANKLTDAAGADKCRMERLPGTDVWALTYRLPHDWRGSYALAPLVPGAAPIVTGADAELVELRRGRALAVATPADRACMHRWFDALVHARPDPYARERLPDATTVASLPDAPPQPWNDPPADVPAGAVVHGALPDGRACRVHHPAGVARTDPLPLLVVLDGGGWAELGLPRTLDALRAADRLPPLRTVGVAAGGPAARTRDLSCDDDFVAALAADVPALVAASGAITADPARTIVAGQSLGGLTAVFATLVAPRRFGCALAQSGSFWWPNPAGGAEPEWLTGVVAHGSRTSGVHLQVGTDEEVLLGPTRRMRDALRARGDAVTYREYSGGHDRACWRGGLVDGLVALTAGWR